MCFMFRLFAFRLSAQRLASRMRSEMPLGKLGLLAVTVGFSGLVMVGPAAAEEEVSFRKDIAPIFVEQCLACHAAKKAEGGYRIDTFTELLKAGDSGELPVIQAASDEVTSDEAAADDTAWGELLRRIVSDDEYERMPAESEPLPGAQIELIRRWLRAGAKFDGEHPETLLPLVTPAVRYEAPPEHYPAPLAVTATLFSPDGSQVLAAGYHEVTVWNAADGTLVRRLQNVGQRTFAMEFDPSGTTLAVACGEPGRSGEVRLIDFASGEVRGVVGRTTDVVFDVAYSGDGKRLAIAAADALVRIIDLETMTTIKTLASHADWVTAVAWSDDGQRLVSASRDKSAKVFDFESGQLLISYQGHGAAVRGVAFLPGGSEVFSSSTGNSLHRWAIADGKKAAEIGLGGGGFQLARRESELLVPSANKRLLKINLADNTIAQEFTGSEDWVLAAALSPDGSKVVAGTHDGKLRVWNTSDGAISATWQASP